MEVNLQGTRTLHNTSRIRHILRRSEKQGRFRDEHKDHLKPPGLPYTGRENIHYQDVVLRLKPTRVHTPIPIPTTPPSPISTSTKPAISHNARPTTNLATNRLLPPTAAVPTRLLNLSRLTLAATHLRLLAPPPTPPAKPRILLLAHRPRRRDDDTPHRPPIAPPLLLALAIRAPALQLRADIDSAAAAAADIRAQRVAQFARVAS